ncbi:MAG: hypothetical protein Roseis2KO_38760 [Roseivirga sp.]
MIAFSYLAISMLVFGNIRLVDHQWLNDYIKKSYPEYEYEMQLVTSRTQTILRRRLLNTKVHLIWDQGEAKVLFQKYDLKPLQINDPVLHNIVNHIRASFSIVEQHQIRFVIAADARIPISSLLAFERVLSVNGIHRVLYRTNVENSRYPWHYPPFQTTGLPKFIHPDCETAKQTLDSFRKSGYKAQQIEWPDFGCYLLISYLTENRVLVKSDTGGFWLNDTPMSEQELLITLTRLIQKYQGNLNVLYQPHPEINFTTYLKGRDIIFQSYIINRNRYAQEKYGLEYDYTDGYGDPRAEDIDRDIRWNYPIAILELTGWNLEFYNYLKE